VLAGIDHVVAMGIADPERLGIGGWSYGAILTNAVIAADTRFKAAISGAGASNMYGMYGHDQYIREYELELGTPWRNRELYDRASFPFCIPIGYHADPVPVRGGGRQRAVPGRRTDVPGAALAQRADPTGGVSRRKPRPHRAELPQRPHDAEPCLVHAVPEEGGVMSKTGHVLALALAGAASLSAVAAERARDLGVPFEGIPGALNAITDVAGVSVGQVTLIEDLPDGHKVRTGVTAILPRGRDTLDTRCSAAGSRSTAMAR
jgi:hypothetical protein